MNTRKWFCCITITLLMQAGHARADCTNPFIVATAPVSPLVIVNGRDVSGDVGDAAMDLLSSRSIDNQTMIINWARALLMAGTGEVDALFPALYSEQRAKYLDYSLPQVGEVRTSIYKHSEISAPPALPDSTVATLRSLEYDAQVLQNATVFEVAEFTQLVAMLEMQRVDYIFGVKEIIDFQISEQPVSHIVEQQVLETRPVYIALAKRSPNYETMRLCLGI